MFAPNLRRKIFGWLERLKNSAGIRLSHNKIRRRRGACLKIRRGGWRRRLRGLISIGYVCAAELTTRSPSSVTKPSDCNNLRILLVYSRHTDSRLSWGHLRLTNCQHSLHRQSLLLVGSHAASPPFGTVFSHLYALLTVSLVLGRNSKLTFSQDSRFAVRASNWYTCQVFRALLTRYLLTYLLT